VSQLSTRYLGLSLSSPIIASASPLTGRLDTLRQLEDAGAAAVVLPSLFEEEFVAEEMSLHAALEQGSGTSAEAADYLPDLDLGPMGPERHVTLVGAAKQALSIPVIASVNATRPGSWSRYATLMVEAGADAVELNLYGVEADGRRSGAEVESLYLDVVREVRAAVTVPLAVKLSPYFSALAHFAGQVVAAGADGLVLFNRFYTPDINLSRLAVEPRVELSTPQELRLPLRWLGILRPQLQDTSLAATSGVHTADDVARALLVGADVACTTSAVLERGPDHIAVMIEDLVTWMEKNEYLSVDQLRGSMSAAGVEDPTAFERGNYVKTLSSYQVKPL
jgi:dihydroorotate dehydrogenase (fumarate)